MHNFSQDPSSWDAFDKVSPRFRTYLSKVLLTEFAKIFKEIPEYQELCLVTQHFLNNSIKEFEFRNRLNDVFDKMFKKHFIQLDQRIIDMLDDLKNCFLYLGLCKYSIVPGYQVANAVTTLSYIKYYSAIPAEELDNDLNRLSSFVDKDFELINFYLNDLEQNHKSWLADLTFAWRN